MYHTLHSVVSQLKTLRKRCQAVLYEHYTVQSRVLEAGASKATKLFPWHQECGYNNNKPSIFDGLYHPFMVCWGMVYSCYTHITSDTLNAGCSRWSHLADAALWFFDSPAQASQGGSLGQSIRSMPPSGLLGSYSGLMGFSSR